MTNPTYYPTPDKLISKMWRKVNNSRKINRILEPSAGQGHIIEYLKTAYSWHRCSISAIEIDPAFQAILRAKKDVHREPMCRVIDSDFLGYSGTDRFDLIIANPPFDDGDKHLLKAIDLMYSGQIVFLLNAETIKNPFSNQRKELVRRLEELKAEIEYIPDAFKDAERKTAVEVALVYINIERDVSDDLFKGCDDKAADHSVHIEQETSVISGNSISGKVESYNDTLAAGLETIELYYRNYNKVSPYLSLMAGSKEDDFWCSNDSLNEMVNDKINIFAKVLRKKYWNELLELKEFRERMTEKKVEEVRNKIDDYSYMDFTESNIRAFLLNLIGDYNTIRTEAVADIFDRMSAKHHWSDDKSENVHYFNGWKTNKSWFVNERVVLPVNSSYGSPFVSWGKWSLNYDSRRWLDDIDKVMNYFDSGNEYISISAALEKAFSTDYKSGQKIDSSYFEIRAFMKGTIHLKFKDENIRRRFNVTACKHKHWLPDDYGKKRYSDMSTEEKRVVEEFEGKAIYQKTLNQIGFAEKTVVVLIA